MDTENNASSENTTPSKKQHNDEYKNCCSICLTAYKSPRILPCKHIFCRVCLKELVRGEDANSDFGLEVVPDEVEEIVSLTCPMCREDINLSNSQIDELPMYFEEEDEDVNAGDQDYGIKGATVKKAGDGVEEDADDDDEDQRYVCAAVKKAVEEDADDVDEDQRYVCAVCENSVPAEYECFQCQKVFCVSCKKNHDTWLKHDVQNLKLDLSQDNCIEHPEVKVGYFCLYCESTICKECVKSEHSLDQTQTLKSYLMEIDGELKEYSSDIEKKLETVEMSKVMFFSNTESIVVKTIENVKNLGEDLKIELEKACRLENKKQHEDQTLLNRIKFMERRIKESRRQRTYNLNLISEIKELQEKITTHTNFYLSNNVDDIIDNQIGMMDVQMGRVFSFQLKDNLKNFNIFFGNINWTLSVVGLAEANSIKLMREPRPRKPTILSSTGLEPIDLPLTKSQPSQLLPSCDLSFTLTPFKKPEDTMLIESITTTVTFYVKGEADNATVSRQFSETFESANDQLKWEFYKYRNSTPTCVQVLFEETNIKHRAQVGGLLL